MAFDPRLLAFPPILVRDVSEDFIKLHKRADNSKSYTGFSSEIGTKLRESAVGQAGGSCYSWAALSSNDSKTL